MAAPVFSTRIIAAHAGATVTYAVPLGFVFVVRSVTGFNANAISSQSVQLVHLSTSCTILQETLGPQASGRWELRFVMTEGEQLRAIGGADCDQTVSGYLLTAP